MSKPDTPSPTDQFLHLTQRWIRSEARVRAMESVFAQLLARALNQEVDDIQDVIRMHEALELNHSLEDAQREHPHLAGLLDNRSAEEMQFLLESEELSKRGHEDDEA